MIALLIGTIILGFSAPMITKQLKHNNLSDIQADVFNRRLTLLQNEIRTLRNEIENIDTGIPSGTIAFFNLATCPDDWSPVIDNAGNTLNGFYPRIALENDPEIGTTKEQMVHKHKHVSPITRADWGVYRRYGPYASSVTNSVGDAIYPAMPSSLNPNIYTAYPSTSYNWSWILYTSDGLNRIEDLQTSSGIRNILTCPNRDEGNNICKPTGNQYNIPYLSEMPLVGNENRPNSVIWLACQKD